MRASRVRHQHCACLQITVAVMPNGRADAVQDAVISPGGNVQTCFVLPLEERMPFQQFAGHLQQQHSMSSSSSRTVSADDIELDATVCSLDDDAQPVRSETRPHSIDLAHQSRHHVQGNDSSGASELTAEYMTPKSASADGQQAHPAQPAGCLSSQQHSASQTDPSRAHIASSRMPMTQAKLFRQKLQTSGEGAVPPAAEQQPDKP